MEITSSSEDIAKCGTDHLPSKDVNGIYCYLCIDVF